MKLSYIKRTLSNNIKTYGGLHPSKYLDHQQKNDIVNQAERLVRQEFVFNRNWDMERCRKAYTLTEMNWESKMNGDEEWCFMLNRMDYLGDLVMASEITNNRKYADKALFYIKDWIKQHPNIKPLDSTRTLDTAIRCWNMLLAMKYLFAYQYIDDVDIELISKSIVDQLKYLREKYICKYTLSNWGSIQTCAIVSIYPYLDENYENNEIFQWALREISVQFPLQVYEDGMLWEQSTMYHVEVLSYGLVLLQQAKIFHIELLEDVKDAIKRLGTSLLLQITPQNTIEAYGDSDEVYALDILQRCAILLEDDTYVSLCKQQPFDPENLYYLQDQAAKTYYTMIKENKLPTYYDGEDGGMYVVRSSWDKNASFTMFVNSSLGSGHGHSDNLQLSIRDQNYRYLIDCGRYTYREDDSMRTKLKSLESHNTMMLDEHYYSYPDSSWTNQAFAKPLKTYTRHVGCFHYYEGSILSMDEQNANFIRKVFVVDEGIWMIVDEVYASSQHTLHTRWHMDESVQLQKQRENEYILKQNTTSLKMYFDQNVVIENANHSYLYNELLDHEVLHAVNNFSNFDYHVTILCRSNIQVEKEELLQNGTTPCDQQVAQAVTFTKPDSTKYTCVCFHKEVYKGKKIFTCRNVPLHTKAAIIVEKDGKQQIVRMKN